MRDVDIRDYIGNLRRSWKDSLHCNGYSSSKP